MLSAGVLISFQLFAVGEGVAYLFSKLYIGMMHGIIGYCAKLFGIDKAVVAENFTIG